MERFCCLTTFMRKTRPALPDLRDEFQSISILLYQDSSLLVIFFRITKNITSRSIDPIAFVSEFVLGDHTLEQYSKLLCTNVRYIEVVTLTGLLKPTARLIIPIVLLHLLINPLQCEPHARLVFIVTPQSRMCCTRL